MTTMRLSLCLCLVLVLAGALPAQSPLADKLPENSILYVGWAGRSLAFDGAMIGQLVKEPGVEEMLAGAKTLIGRQLQGKGEDAALFDNIWSMAGVAWQHPIAAALFDMTKAPSGGEPRPVGAVLIDLQKDRAAFATSLQAVLAAAGKNVKITPAASDGVSYQTFPTPAGPCGMGFVGDVFFLSLGETAADTVIALLSGKGKSLAAQPAFAAAMKEVMQDQPQSAYYVNVPRLLEVVERVSFTRRPPGAVATVPAESEMKRGLRALGLAGVKSVAGAANIVDRGIHEKLRISSPAPHRGALMLLAGKPLPANALGEMPGDAMLAAGIMLDASAVLAELRRAAAEIEPGADKKIDSALAAASQEMGFDIEKDLLASMGEQWTLVSAPSLGGLATGTVLTVQLKDQAKFQAALARLEALLSAALDGKMKSSNGSSAGVPPSGVGPSTQPPPAKSAISVIKSGNVEVHSVSLTALSPVMPVAPAWAVANGKFYLAAFPQVVLAAIAGSNEKGLGESPAFVAARKRVSANASAVVYTDPTRLLREFYGVLLAGWTAAANAPQTGGLLRPDMLPTLPKLEKYIWPSITAISQDTGGITIESYGSLPGGSFVLNLVPNAPLAASILLPSLSRARGLARRAVSGANLNSIGKATMMYQAENKDKFPPDLAALVKAGCLSPRMLMHPDSQRPVPADWKSITPENIDCVYLGAKMTVAAPANLLLAYERPEFGHGEGVNVLFVDSHVKFATMAEFKRVLDETEKYLAKQK